MYRTTVTIPCGPGETLELTLTFTQAYQEMSPCPAEKRLRVAVKRTDLAAGPRLSLVHGLCLPCTGLHRGGADAWAGTADKSLVVGGDREMRNFLGMKDIVLAIADQCTAEGVIPSAWTGLGNVVMNRGCMAFWEGQLICSTQDLNDKAYYALLVFKNGEVAIKKVLFCVAGGRCLVVVGGRDVTSEVHFAVTGPPLVLEHAPLDPHSDRTLAEMYCDKRHLILSPYSQLKLPNGTDARDDRGNRIRRDFGLEQILAKPERLWQAIAGEVVEDLELAVTDVDGKQFIVNRADLEEAFHEKSYKPTSRNAILKRGQYCIDNNRLHLRYHMSPYPHKALCVRKAEPTVLWEVFVGGASNNAGCNLSNFAEDLSRVFDGAIVIEDGGDVACVVAGDTRDPKWSEPNGPNAVIPSSLGRRQWSAALLYHNGLDGAGANASDVWVKDADLKNDSSCS